MSTVITNSGSRAFNAFSWIAAALGLSAVALAVFLQIAGLHLVIVQTGSMNPAIPPGSVVLTRPIPAAEAKVGQVLTIKQPQGNYVTHRLVSIKPAANGMAAVVETKGDANLTKDPLPLTVQSVNRVQYVIPEAGKILDAMSSRSAGMWFGALIMVGIAVAWRDMTGRNNKPSYVPGIAVTPPITDLTEHEEPVTAPAPVRRSAELFQVPLDARFGSMDARTAARLVALSVANPDARPSQLAALAMGVPEEQFVNPELVSEVLHSVVRPPAKLERPLRNRVAS